MTEIVQNSAALEAELNELSRQIEEKRNQLEVSRGVRVEHKEAVREVISKEVYGESYVPPPPPAQSAQNSTTPPATNTPPSYLDRLDGESVAVINELVQAVPRDGVRKTIARAKDLPPFLLDAFHDALVDKLYEELKRINAV